MSREVIRMLTERSRGIKQLASEGNIEALKKTGFHKDKNVRRILTNARAANTKAKNIEAKEAVEAAKIDRKKELADRKHDIREILKYNKKAA